MIRGAKWKGVDDAVAAIKSLGDIAAPEVLEGALLKVARPIAAEMAEFAPALTGRTAESIRAAPVRDDDDPDTVRVDVGARGGKRGRAYIARWLEFGRFRQRAQPFMRPVWDEHRERFAADYVKALRPAYLGMVRRLTSSAKRRAAA